jgi:tripartite-type tricarboxylate transporter receptor subunit TctC
LEERYGWTIIPQQVTGRGGLALAQQLKNEPADGTVIAMTASETLTYNILVSNSDLALEDFTPIATTAAFQTGLVAAAASGWTDLGDVIAEARDGRQIRFGAITERMADLGIVLGDANDVEFNIVNVSGGAGVMNGLVAGDLDIGLVAGAQTPGVLAGDLVNLASAISTPLAASPDAPLLSEFGVPYTIDGYFLIAAPAGMDPDVRSALAGAIEAVVTDPETRTNQLITRAFEGAAVLSGNELDDFLKRDRESSAGLIEAVQ